MKTYFVLYLAAALGMVDTTAEPDPRIKQFDALPSGEALKLFMDSNDPPNVQNEMIRAALRDKRRELISLLFKNNPSFHNLLSGLNEIPNSDFKDEVVVIMLRTESGFWRSEDPIYNGSRGVTFDNAVEPFVGTIGKHLPTVSIDEKLFSTKASRLKLATELEEAMTRTSASSAKENVRPRKEGVPQKRQSDSPFTASAGTNTNYASKSDGRVVNKDSNLKGFTPSEWWIASCCFVLLLAALGAWFKAHKSRSDT